MYILLKADNEDLKTKMKTDFQKLSKEVLDRDRLTKEVELLKKENARLKKNKPQQFSEERYLLIKKKSEPGLQNSHCFPVARFRQKIIVYNLWTIW